MAVGVSFHDENAETIVFNVKNPITNGLSSTVQQCLRNRAKPPLSIYLMKYKNALPLATKQAIGFETEHAKQKLADGEVLPQGLIDQLGIKAAMQSLEADQPEIFFTHHLQQAGYEVQIVSKDWESVDFEQVQETRKRIKDVENEQVKAIAQEILCPEQMLTEREIRNKDWEQLKPTPTLQLSHERANALLRATGWDGNVERFADETNLIEADPRRAFQDAGVTDEMWTAARAALQADLSPDKIKGWSKGYLTTHHEATAFDEFEQSREYETHHRSDAIFIGSILKALLEKLPLTPAPMEAVGQALIDAAQTPFGKDRLSTLMKDGSTSDTIAKQVRFIDLGKDARPTQAHFDFVKRFIAEYYPARIAKVGDSYQLAAAKDTVQVESFKRIMECRIKHKTPDSDPDPENGNLTPPPASDPKAKDKVLVISMRSQGHSYRDIEQATGMPRNTIHRWYSETSSRPTNFPGSTYTRNEWDTPTLTESPPTPNTTAFEPDSQKLAAKLAAPESKLAAPESKLAAGEAASLVGLEAHCKLILELLKSGEKKRNEIVASLEVNIGSIDRALSHLVETGELIKVKDKWGVYDLPIRAIAFPEKGAKFAYSPYGKIEFPSTFPPEIRDALAASINDWRECSNELKSLQVKLESHCLLKNILKAFFKPLPWIKEASHLVTCAESFISQHDHHLVTIHHILDRYKERQTTRMVSLKSIKERMKAQLN